MPVFTRIAYSGLRWGHFQLKKESYYYVWRWGCIGLSVEAGRGEEIYVHIYRTLPYTPSARTL
jgi:hypothetical protein